MRKIEHPFPELPDLASQRTLAELLGVKPSYVAKLQRAGRLVTDRGRIRVRETLARIVETATYGGGAAERAARLLQASPDAARDADRSSMATNAADDADVHASDDDLSAIPDYQRARAMREHYSALQARREYELAIGRLVEAEAVAQAARHAGVLFRSAVEVIPDRLAPQLAVESDEQSCRALLAEEFEQALEELHRALLDLARGEDP